MGEEPFGGMEGPGSQVERVERHWRSLAPNGELPRRRDLDAGFLGPSLPHAFTFEEEAPGSGRLRVAGQALHEWFGADPRGVPLSVLFEEASRPTLRQALLDLFARPALVELALTTPRSSLRAPLGGRLLLLPLEGEDGEATRALGVIGLDAAPPPGPRRFALQASAPRRLEPVSLRSDPVPIPMGAFAMPAPQPTLGLAESERPWLRLVISND